MAWFASYLSNRQQSIKIGKAVSSPRHLPDVIPKGSVLGPQLFSIYTQPLQNLIQRCGMSFHLYADDTQLYLAFDPKSPNSITNMSQILSNCTAEINAWMDSHFLKLNSDKTELVIITTPTLSNHNIQSLDMCDTVSLPSAQMQEILGSVGIVT